MALKSDALKGVFQSTFFSFNSETPRTQRLEIAFSSQEHGCCVSVTPVMIPSIFVNSVKTQTSAARKARGEKVLTKVR